MVRETVQSLKADNEKLKKRVEALARCFQGFKAKQADGHVESTSEDAKQMKSLEYLTLVVYQVSKI